LSLPMMVKLSLLWSYFAHLLGTKRVEICRD
jgi:hypothetical protein